MFANVFTKTSRDRLAGMAIGAVAIALMLWMGTAVYKDIDLTLYFETMPPAFLELMGIPDTGDAAGLAFGAIYSFMGALTVAGLAISMGTASIAGEEVNGTMGLLLGNPKSRTSVLLSKTLSLLAVVAVGGLILWGAGYAVPAMLGVDMAPFHVGALVFHMSVNAVFYGLLATAVGAWTGSAKAASGTAIAVMVISYLATGILPLIEGLEDVAKLFPWYYFNHGAPVSNGIDWGDMAVLGSLAALFLVIAVVGVNRRDLRSRSIGASLIDRLREHPLTKKATERIAGSARVSRIAMKTASENQGLLVICSIIMFYIALMMGPIYNIMDEAILSLAAQLPDALVAMVGGVDMSTAEGYLQAEIFSITGPATFGVLTILIGSRAVAGEEQRKTMDLLLASPVTRSKIIAEKSLAMVLYSLILGLVTFLGTWGTVVLGGLDIPVTNVAATSTLLTLLGLVVGGVALLVGSATGRTRWAAYTAAGVTLFAYFLWSFMPLSEKYAGWAKLSPFHYYLGSDPLVNGMHWGHAAVLVGLFLGLVVLSMPALQRRDLR
ncbi:MAG: ABC transporter permease subunit [Actinomycetota bacterium]|nr:ABC transporter permease subunit [Actinomycetota bacterium]